MELAPILLPSIIAIVFFFIIAGSAIIIIIKWLGKRATSPNKKNIDFLEEKLTKGEITKEEFDKLKKM